MRKIVILLSFIIIIAIATLIIWQIQKLPTIVKPPPPPTPPKPPLTKTVYLYFPNHDSTWFEIEPHRITKQTLIEEIKATLKELSKGPSNPALHTLVPPFEICFRNISYKSNRIIIDLHETMQFNRLGKNYFAGSTGEYFGVYSIVNTLTKSFPQIDEVQFLVGGKPADTLTGHLDLTQPLKFDPTRVKEQ